MVIHIPEFALNMRLPICMLFYQLKYLGILIVADISLEFDHYFPICLILIRQGSFNDDDDIANAKDLFHKKG